MPSSTGCTRPCAPSHAPGRIQHHSGESANEGEKEDKKEEQELGGTQAGEEKENDDGVE